MFQMGMGPARMTPPNVAQMQNQYLPPGQFPGSGPMLSSGSVGMTQQGTQGSIAQVRRNFYV